MTQSNRGKWAEAKVIELLTERSQNVGFTFARLPDAHAGSKVPALADFDALQNGVYYLLEVKEVNHEFRLPHKNFATDKVSRMVRRQMAGAICYVLVYHEPYGGVGRAWASALSWRLVPLEVFQKRDGGSWDLKSYPLTTLRMALNQMLSPNGA